MLVLTTRKNGKVRIIYKPTGEMLDVSVEDIAHGRVRHGFDGPRNFDIVREEVLNRTEPPKAA